MSAFALATRTGKPAIVARNLIRAHHERYPKFWAMVDGAVACVMQGHAIQTVFGWPIRPSANTKERSIMNYPMQANGAEMMRLAACLATERGIEVCAPVHDAFLICAPLDRIEADTAAMKEIMEEASRIVLDGFTVRAEHKIFRYPERFMDEKRGRVMWDRVMRLLPEGQYSDEEIQRRGFEDYKCDSAAA
jgi:DNA polymerase-1